MVTKMLNRYSLKPSGIKIPAVPLDIAKELARYRKGTLNRYVLRDIIPGYLANSIVRVFIIIRGYLKLIND